MTFTEELKNSWVPALLMFRQGQINLEGALNEILLQTVKRKVVRKVDRELPDGGVAVKTKEFNEGFRMGQDYYKMQIRKAGLTAVEEIKI